MNHGGLASLGSTGDAYDNATAESFENTFKTELVANCVWRPRSRLELAIVEWIGWYNHRRPHSALGDLPPAEFEALRAPRFEPSTHTIKIQKPTITVSGEIRSGSNTRDETSLITILDALDAPENDHAEPGFDLRDPVDATDVEAAA